MHSCLRCFKPHIFFLFIQWLLPAPLSVPRSPPASLALNCPLLERMENAPSASTGRWTRSSTPADTCVCATTVGWSWRDRLMRAAQYAGGRSKMWSKHIGRDFNRRCDFTAGTTCFPFSGFVGHRPWPRLKIATPGHNCAYISMFFTGKSFLENDQTLHTQACDWAHFNAYCKHEWLYFWLRKTMRITRSSFFPHLMSLRSHVVSRKTCCEYFVFTFIVLDLCVLQQNMWTVVYDF